MKKYIYISLLFLSAACQKEDVLRYEQEKDGLQFNYEEMSMDYDFAMQTKMVMKGNEWGEIVPTKVYRGDSISRDTISLLLSLMGYKSEIDREFKLKAIPVKGQDSTRLLKVEFFPSYSFHAGQLKDTVQVVLLRPETRGKFTIGITFDTDDADALFEPGVTEQGIYRIRVSDEYKKPVGWDLQIDYLGEYSEEKYAFYITILGELYDPYKEMHFNNLILRKALQAYNAEHPDKQKDFTFPVNAYPEWWGYCQNYVGEYSDEKMEFMMEVLGVFQSWDDWSSHSRKLREALEAYNAAHPDDQKEFTFPEVSNKPQWWEAYADFVGEYSDEKMEFIEEVLGPPIQPWMLMEYIQDLRDALEAYNAAHPDAPKDFTFPEPL